MRAAWILAGAVLACVAGVRPAHAGQSTCDSDGSRHTASVHFLVPRPALHLVGTREQVHALLHAYRVHLQTGGTEQAEEWFCFTRTVGGKDLTIRRRIRFCRVSGIAAACRFDWSKGASGQPEAVDVCLRGGGRFRHAVERPQAQALHDAHASWSEGMPQTRFDFGFKLQTTTEYIKRWLVVDFRRVRSLRVGAVPPGGGWSPPGY